MKKNKLISIILLFFGLFLYSCQTMSEALSGKKRSDQGDEFLVEKKNPLVLPPDYGELPMPQDNQVDKNNDAEENEFEILIKNTNKGEPSATEKNINPKSIEESILQKIE